MFYSTSSPGFRLLLLAVIPSAAVLISSSAEDFCGDGDKRVSHITPSQGGASLLARLQPVEQVTPTFQLPINRGCLVEPLGVEVNSIEAVSYQRLGSVEASLILPSKGMPTGGFRLSFAANQALKIQPANIDLPGKESTSYSLECKCPIGQRFASLDASPSAASNVSSSRGTRVVPMAMLSSWGESAAVEPRQKLPPASSEVLAVHVSQVAPVRQSDATLVPESRVAPAGADVPLPDGAGASFWRFQHGVREATQALVQSLSLAIVVKAACMASNVAFQVSPLPLARGWRRSESTGEADAAPFVALAVGCWQWCFYGMFAWLATGRDGFLILVYSNCLGAGLGTWYVVTFWRHCATDVRRCCLVGYLKMGALLAGTQCAGMVLLPSRWSLMFVGLAGSFCSLMNAVALLVPVSQALRTKSSSSIPGPLVLAGFMSSFFWFICGTMLQDPCILVPNGVTLCINILCLGLKWRYPVPTVDSKVESKRELMVSFVDSDEVNLPAVLDSEHVAEASSFCSGTGGT